MGHLFNIFTYTTPSLLYGGGHLKLQCAKWCTWVIETWYASRVQFHSLGLPCVIKGEHSCRVQFDVMWVFTFTLAIINIIGQGYRKLHLDVISLTTVVYFNLNLTCSYFINPTLFCTSGAPPTGVGTRRFEHFVYQLKRVGGMRQCILYITPPPFGCSLALCLSPDLAFLRTP